MRAAFEICQPSGELGEEESALAQCFMAIAGFVRKMSGTSDIDAESMNRYVARMVEEALKYNTKTEFFKGNQTAYRKALEMGVIDDFFVLNGYVEM